jgi:hypothetical protein
MTVTAPKGGGAHNGLSTRRNESTSSLHVPNGRIHRPRIIYSALVVEADDGRTALLKVLCQILGHDQAALAITAADARRNSLGVRARR